MVAYLYTWSPVDGKWVFNDICDTVDLAKEKGRKLWREGAAGIKIDELVTKVETVR